MDIFVNGEALSHDASPETSLGEALAAVDELLERSGMIIVALSVDGASLDADSYAALKERRVVEVGRVDLVVEAQAGIRGKALSTLLELVSLAAEAAGATVSQPATAAASSADAAGEAHEGKPEDWAAIKKGAEELAEAFGGLFPADELSLARGFAEAVGLAADEAARAREAATASLGAASKGAAAQALRELCERLTAILAERLAELQEPKAEMRKAALLYERQAPELAELPVYLQTGKEERAMKAVLLFIELFNKVIRLMPELARVGVDTAAIRIEGKALPEFYADFNDILRKLSGAFEAKDSVLIGDLAEYEVAPRMSAFFAAAEAAL